MLSFKKISLGIILALLVLVLCEDEEKKEEEEEKDPWDKSTDKYRHHLGDSRGGPKEEEPVKIDVTEVSESEVHSGRSKVCKHCKPKIVARTAPQVANATKPRRKPLAQYFNKNDVDDETKEQIIDATDEKDPADSRSKDSKLVSKDNHKNRRKQHRASKKQLNPKIDYNPGNLWEYPYPYQTNMKYGCGVNNQECDEAIEAKEEAKEQGHLENLLFSTDAKATPVPQEAKIESAVPPEESALQALSKPVETDKLKNPQPVPKVEGKEDKKSKSKRKKEEVEVLPKIKGFARRWRGHPISEIGRSWGTPCFYNADSKKFSCKQLIPSHYYGPPSAGWGGFQPGHTGSGWGVPHWNRKKCTVPHKHCRQLIPVHYYGPPSAGWGGFQPGHTGAGWGTPHWNKRCHTPRVNCKPLYGNAGKNSWFIYNPHGSGSWASTPHSWYRNGLETHYAESPGSMRYKVSRPEDTINRITPLVVRQRNNVAALHEWITFLENEREKDRQLERYKLAIKDKENQRRYNLDVLRYKQAQDTRSPLSQLDVDSMPQQTGSPQIRYYTHPEFGHKAVEYVVAKDGQGTTALYNDKK